MCRVHVPGCALGRIGRIVFGQCEADTRRRHHASYDLLRDSPVPDTRYRCRVGANTASFRGRARRHGQAVDFQGMLGSSQCQGLARQGAQEIPVGLQEAGWRTGVTGTKPEVFVRLTGWWRRVHPPYDVDMIRGLTHGWFQPMRRPMPYAELEARPPSVIRPHRPARPAMLAESSERNRGTVIPPPSVCAPRPARAPQRKSCYAGKSERTMFVSINKSSSRHQGARADTFRKSFAGSSKCQLNRHLKSSTTKDGRQRCCWRRRLARGKYSDALCNWNAPN